MVKNWLITGGCGFIGVNLIRVLKKRGDYIRVVDNMRIGSRDDLRAVTEFTEVQKFSGVTPGAVELLEGDMRDEATMRNAAEGVDAIVHLAAQSGVIPSIEDPRLDCDLNVNGLLNVLEAARHAGVKSFVFASSSAPLGNQEQPVHEQKVPKPLSPYGASKLAGEAYCSAYHASFGINTVCLRFANAYGPYSFKKGSVVALFFRRTLKGEPLYIYGDGKQTRDFIHTDDLCQAIVKGAEKGVGGEVFQVATGVETSVNEITGKIKAIVERDTDMKVEITYKPPRAGEMLRNVSDISKAKKMLGYDPAVKLDDGLEETWAWFREFTAARGKV